MTAKLNSLEVRREKWLRQLAADRKKQDSYFIVAWAIGIHLNRNRGGWGWPGIKTLARISGKSENTVRRAVRWLKANGHLEVVSRRIGKRYLPNHYRPTLRNVTPMQANVAPPTAIAVAVPPAIAVSTEPSSEPLREPNIQIRISAASNDADENIEIQQGRKGSGIREGSKCKSSVPIESPSSAESLTSESYRLARENYGERGAALVTKALRTTDARDVLAEIRDAIESGEDLGYVLWRP